MNRRLVFLGVAAVALFAFVAFGIWGGGNWGDHSQVTRIVPGANGETLVITENGNRGFFPFFPFFFVIPVLWFLVIGGVFSFFGRRRWAMGQGSEPPMQAREAWLADWHRAQHSGKPADAPGATDPTDAQADQSSPNDRAI